MNGESFPAFRDQNPTTIFACDSLLNIFFTEETVGIGKGPESKKQL
jgi:hypothetical protein